jgi:hypothetical protein
MALRHIQEGRDFAIRLPNGALSSLAGNVDPHHAVSHLLQGWMAGNSPTGFAQCAPRDLCAPQRQCRVPSCGPVLGEEQITAGQKLQVDRKSSTLKIYHSDYTNREIFPS